MESLMFISLYVYSGILAALLILIPLSFIKKSGKFYGTILQISSYIYAATLWLFCSGLIYEYYGTVTLINGVSLFAAGVFPVTAAGAVSNSDWTLLGSQIVIGLLGCIFWYAGMKLKNRNGIL